jgi:hypothetical protein
MTIIPHFRSYIHDHLAGKTVHAVLTNGHELIIQCTSGEEVVIVWNTDGPVLLRQDAKVSLVPVGMFGLAGF